METSNKTKLSTEYKTARRKFTQSILKWSADDCSVEEEKPENPPDVGDLVNILRSVGFKLREFEKYENMDSKSASTFSLNNAKCKVELTCGQSGLRAILETIVGECRCPSLESAKQAEFWHVSGSAPVHKGSQESLSSTQEAGSTLVPPLPPAVEAVVKDVMARILKLMCDPKLGELDTSSRSLMGSGQKQISRRCSLETLSIPEQASRSYSSTEHLDGAEQEKKTFSRTVSNIELSTCPLSPVPGDSSPADSLKHQSPWSSTTMPSRLSSPISKLSKSLEKVSIREKHSIYCRLEVAKRSITEAMSMLDVQPLTIDLTKKQQKLLEHTSTPSSRTRRSGIANSPSTKVSPKSAKTSTVTGTTRKAQSLSAVVKRATQSSTKRTPGIPVPTRLLVRSESCNVPTTPVSHVTPKVKKLATTPCTKKDEKVHVKSDISTGSSSSASSSSSKVRMFKNVVRRVSRLSSGGDSPRSSNSQNK